MKGLKISLVIMAAVLLTLGTGGIALAFHSGGVAECEGCHSMHAPAAGGTFLLVGATQSETCLTCHENAADTGPTSYHISTTGSTITGLPLQRTPGGDFGWLKKTFTYTYGTPAVTYTETGGGHNINAPTNGYAQASGTAPGGTFNAANLACNSCHDPHGKKRRLVDNSIADTGAPIWASGSYSGTTAAANEPAAGKAVGAYRLLAGSGYSNALSGTIGFTGIPVAKAPSTYNRTESTTQTRVAYGKAIGAGTANWGDWCKTCHANMHSNGNTVHPTDEGLGDMATNYNAYVKSGDLTGVATSSFQSLVPFMQNASAYTDLIANAKNNDTALGGPGISDQVACLSCHRAHASGFSHMLRFDYGYEFMTKGGSYIGSDNSEVGTTGRGPLQSRGRTIADWQAAYYDRPATQFATYQRVLCNKCHAKD